MQVCSTKYFKTCAVMKYDVCKVLTFILLGTTILPEINGYQDTLWVNGIEYQGCEVDSDPCILTCKFKLKASNANITWRNESSVINSSLVSHSVSTSYINSSLTLNKDTIGSFSCIVYTNSSDQVLNHTFHISGNQSSPNITNQFYNISGEGNCNVTFTCTIQVNAPPDVIWMKRGVGHVKLLIIENEQNWTNPITSDEYEAVLLITNFNYDNDGGSYRCIALNDIGVSASAFMFPYIKPGKPTVDQKRIIFKPGDKIHANCTSNGGFPAPIITWEFQTGIHVNKTNNTTVDNGETVSYLTAVSQWSDKMGVLSCNVKDRVAKTTNTIDIKLYFTDIPFMIGTNSCTPSSFTNNNSSCILSCEAYSKSYFTYQWIYTFAPGYTDNPDFPLVDSTYEKDGIYITSVELTDYWAGAYTCILKSGRTNLTNTFQIENATMGKAIGGICQNEHECGALNSECAKRKCQCPEDYPIYWGDNKYTSACLEVAQPEESCLNDAQCQAAADHYTCYHSDHYSEYGSCECRDPYFIAYVTEIGSWQCILKAGYMEKCDYDAQCFYTDPYLECTSYGYCDCKDGYYYSSTDNWCQYNTMAHYLSLTATVGIVVGVTVIIVIIFILAMMYIRANTIKTRRRYEQAAAMRQSSNNNFPPNMPNPGDNSTLPPYPVDLPPSYFEAQRSETPPPSFDSIVETKLDNEVDEHQNCIILTPEYDSRSISSINPSADANEGCSHTNQAFDAEC